MIFPYVEKNPAIFRCPDGLDTFPGSPTQGEWYQVSYALNGVNGGPCGKALLVISNGNGSAQVMLAWEHSNLPACAFSQPGGPPVPWPFTDVDAPRHYAARHIGVFNVLFCDGHVTSMVRSDLQLPLFYAQP
jgi:prepilin-type processing-associated H-X9-DG protein